MRKIRSRNLADMATALGLICAVLSLLSQAIAAAVGVGVLAIVTFVASVLLQRRERKREEGILAEIQSRITADRLLDVVARQLSLGGERGGWRMSLYHLDVQEEYWRLRSRAASNELYADFRDFPTLGPEQGVLRACIPGSERPDGRFDQMPPLPSPNDPRWAEVMHTWGISESTSRVLRMKSQSYCGAVFKVGIQDGHQATLAIVAESETPDGVNIHVLESALTRPFFESLAEILALDRALSGLRAGSAN